MHSNGVCVVRISRRRQYAAQLLQHIRSSAAKQHLRAVHTGEMESWYVQQYRRCIQTTAGRWNLHQIGYGPLEDDTVRTRPSLLLLIVNVNCVTDVIGNAMSSVCVWMQESIPGVKA